MSLNRINDMNLVGQAASRRTHAAGQERNMCNQIVHSNDKQGSKFWNPGSGPGQNPYQGHSDRSAQARRDWCDAKGNTNKR